ncbi:MAG: IclR family transcriptional regulator C-terminal domain-containing protein, partial [Deltaproteobacteria bacterium]|nr:IclR family transcriptional regulator C-terminal domain-containing protein [Deltaproteobacteria bacterium]
KFIEQQLQTAALEPLTSRTIVDIDKFRAELSTIRKQGYAVSSGERNPGIGSLSVPVFSHRGTLAAALSIALPEIRYRDIKHRKICLQELLAAAKGISKIMGGNP